MKVIAELKVAAQGAIVITRGFDAPRKKVFRPYTEPVLAGFMAGAAIPSFLLGGNHRGQAQVAA